MVIFKKLFLMIFLGGLGFAVGALLGIPHVLMFVGIGIGLFIPV